VLTMVVQNSNVRNTGPSRSGKRKGRDSEDDEGGSIEKVQKSTKLCVFDYLCNQCHAMMLTNGNH